MSRYRVLFGLVGLVGVTFVGDCQGGSDHEKELYLTTTFAFAQGFLVPDWH
jgi:hypothetical protein